jgi:hypothetical protein
MKQRTSTLKQTNVSTQFHPFKYAEDVSPNKPSIRWNDSIEEVPTSPDRPGRFRKQSTLEVKHNNERRNSKNSVSSRGSDQSSRSKGSDKEKNKQGPLNEKEKMQPVPKLSAARLPPTKRFMSTNKMNDVNIPKSKMSSIIVDQLDSSDGSVMAP